MTDTTPMSLRLDRQLAERVAEAAARDERSVSGWIRKAIIEKLERELRQEENR